MKTLNMIPAKGLVASKRDIAVKMAMKTVPLVLFMTTCITVPSFYRGVITAKYFYFATVMCIALPLVIYSAFLQRKPLFLIRAADIAFLLFILYIIIHRAVLGGTGGMDWWLFLLMIPLYMAIRVFSENRNGLKALTLSLLLVVWVQLLWGFLQLSGLLPSYHGAFRVTGSLFNPGPYAGFVAVGIPLGAGLFFSRDAHGRERVLDCAVFLSSVAMLPFTGSRAAWLAALAGLTVLIPAAGKGTVKSMVERLFPRKTPRLLFIFSITTLIIFLLHAAYLLKKDSADGRLFIWKVSMSIIKEHPAFGVGTGRFPAVYGQAQADYFLSGKGTPGQAMVADHPEYAFNEYVHVAVELGLAGLLLFLAVTGICLFPVIGRGRSNRKSPAGHYFPALVTLLVFSFFSYPFEVLPLLMMFVALLAVTASRTTPARKQPGSRVHISGWVVLLALTSVVASRVLPLGQSYRDWQEASVLLRSGAYASALDEYQLLHERLHHEKKFLMEYARCLSHVHDYSGSNRVLGQYLGAGCDPEAYNYMGNNHKAMGEYAEAEKAYTRSSLVTPNRHYPEYLLMRLYQDAGRREEALGKARYLMEKPVKINSPVVRRIRQEAAKMIEEHGDGNK